MLLIEPELALRSPSSGLKSMGQCGHPRVMIVLLWIPDIIQYVSRELDFSIVYELCLFLRSIFEQV